LNFAVYCTPQPDLGKIALHAAYVVAQTAVEVVLAIRLRHAETEAAELLGIVAHIDRGREIGLDVSGIPVSEPTAVSLKEAINKMRAAMGEVDEAADRLGGAIAQIAQGS